jgi:phage shock protein C
VVEHFHGKEGVSGSNPEDGSIFTMRNKRLYKTKDGAMLFGVCAGLAEYFDIDPTLVRLLLVASVFFGGMGIVVYLVAAVILPNKSDVYTPPKA